MKRFNPEAMSEVADRMERIRDYTPSEEFNPTTALMIAKNEVLPFCNAESWAPGGTDGG